MKILVKVQMIPFNEFDWKLKQDDFEIKRKGFLDNFYRAIQKSTGRNCIIQRTHCELYDGIEKILFDNDRSILSSQHQAIVPFIGFFEKKKDQYIVMEEMENGDLRSFLEKCRKGFIEPLWDNTHKLIISYGISSALKHLHERQIVCSDLQASHILLDSEFHPYLYNFGYSQKTDQPVSEKIMEGGSPCPPIYMAPEYIEDMFSNMNTFPIDIYAYGMILYEIITGLVPFPGLNSPVRVYQAVTSGDRPEIPSSVPPNWCDLIEKCWKHYPNERPTIELICELLESDEFVDESIDKQLFEDYKESLKLRRCDSQFKKIKELKQKVASQENQIEDLTKQVTSLQNDLKNSQNTKSSPLSYNPFEGETSRSPNEDHFIGEDDADFYKVVKKIGEGATAVVYKVIDTRTNQVLCKKTLKFQEQGNAFRNVQNAYKEFEALCLVKHPGICQAVGMNTAEPIEGTEATNEEEEEKVPTTISIYLEYLSRSLKECIDKKILDNTLKVRIVVDIVHALNFIHKHNMIHRDIKIENIMLNSAFDAKVVDFGLARIDECFTGKDFVSTSLTKGIGTLAYMSPEMASEEEYSNKTDVYSFGILLHYIFVGKLPDYNLKDKLHSKPVPMPKPSSQVSQFCIDLMMKCTESKPDSRPSFEDILKEMRDNSYQLAAEIDLPLIKKRDNELSFYESLKM